MAEELARSRSELAAALREVHQLRSGLAASRQIGMAMGILMCRHQLTQEQAFDQLREMSNRRNVKLRDIAAEVVPAPGGHSVAVPPAVCSTDGT